MKKTMKQFICESCGGTFIGYPQRRRCGSVRDRVGCAYSYKRLTENTKRATPEAREKTRIYYAEWYRKNGRKRK